MTFEEMWQELEKQDPIFIKARKLADIEVKKIEEEHDRRLALSNSAK